MGEDQGKKQCISKEGDGTPEETLHLAHNEKEQLRELTIYVSNEVCPQCLQCPSRTRGVLPILQHASRRQVQTAFTWLLTSCPWLGCMATERPAFLIEGPRLGQWQCPLSLLHRRIEWSVAMPPFPTAPAHRVVSKGDSFIRAGAELEFHQHI